MLCGWGRIAELDVNITCRSSPITNASRWCLVIFFEMVSGERNIELELETEFEFDSFHLESGNVNSNFNFNASHSLL